MAHTKFRFLFPFVFAIAVLWALSLLIPDTSQAAKSTAEIQVTPVTITYWHPYTGTGGVLMGEFIREFNDTNTYGITVTGQYIGDTSEIYYVMLERLRNGGELPNLVASYPSLFADFARYGRVRFLDGYLDDPVLGISDLEDFYPHVLNYFRLGQYGYQLSGLQHNSAIEVMYYNADLLDAEGLPVPATWDEFETACISLTTDTVSGTIPTTSPEVFQNLLWSRGGEMFSEDFQAALFDEQPGIDSALLFQDLIQNDYARLPLYQYEFQDSFSAGSVGFVINSSSGIPFTRDDMLEEFNWGVTRVPAVPGHEAVNNIGAGTGIIHQDDNADTAAWLFLKWLTETDQNARWAASTPYFPIRISAQDHVSITEKLADDPQYAQAFELLPLERSDPGVIGYIDIRLILEEAIYNILGNGANVTETLHTAAQAVDLILLETGAVTSEISPEGGSLAYTTTQGTTFTAQFPPEAVATTETVSYVPLYDLPTDGLAFALVPDLEFNLPVTVTIHYQDADILGMDESTLKLYNFDWPSNSWVDAEPCGGYWRDIEENILQAFICHFSDYALVDKPFKIHLPLIQR